MRRGFGRIVGRRAWLGVLLLLAACGGRQGVEEGGPTVVRRYECVGPYWERPEADPEGRAIEGVPTLGSAPSFPSLQGKVSGEELKPSAEPRRRARRGRQGAP